VTTLLDLVFSSHGQSHIDYTHPSLAVVEGLDLVLSSHIQRRNSHTHSGIGVIDMVPVTKTVLRLPVLMLHISSPVTVLLCLSLHILG